MNASKTYVPNEIPALPAVNDLKELSNEELLHRMQITVDRDSAIAEVQWLLPEGSLHAAGKLQALREETSNTIKLLAEHLTA